MPLSGEALDQALNARAVLVGSKPRDWEALKALAAPLKYKNETTRLHYEHSGRVALLASDIAQFVHLDPKPLFYAGYGHDLGKCLIPRTTLGKTGTWTADDARVMRRHVTGSYEMLRDRFDFTAAIVLWHHRFQVNGYPLRLPKQLHKYSEATRLLIVESGRHLAVADVFDALHRTNSKFAAQRSLTEDEIKTKMFELNPDRPRLIGDLYNAGILTMR